MEGSGPRRLARFDFVVEATLFWAPVRSNAPSPSTGGGWRTFGATMTSAWGDRRANGRWEGSFRAGSIWVTLMTAVDVGDRYMVMGCSVVIARI